MKTFSNTYIFTFATIMVVAVAALLSVVAMQLQPMQKKNYERNKKQNILLSLNVESTKDDAIDKYDQYITESYVINNMGEMQEDVEAFPIELEKELEKEPDDRNLPVFEGTIDDQKIYVLPVRGKGLWGPIWGYIAIEDDFNTIYGANFSHDSETPGLGAEISTRAFQKQFIGKKLFDDSGDFVSVQVIKGDASPDAEHEVDGISGGTITSKGVDAMIEDVIGDYLTFLEQNRKNN
ncbi:MAG: NADH:ubiquinone reductase (Na(+)-transporting) subunit C [Bacteroidales bacterium]